MTAAATMTPERWLALMNAWEIGVNAATFQALLAAYSEDGRHYHTAEHVAACLRHLDSCAASIDAPEEVELALWFHDAIYRPFSGSNEKDSADWACTFLLESGADPAKVERVRRLIMVTEHSAPAQTHDETVLVDIDLAILGAEPAVYELFERAVRREYQQVPLPLYRRKRAEIFRGFLQRAAIYPSGIFTEEAEQRARSNLAAAIASLEAGL